LRFPRSFLVWPGSAREPERRATRASLFRYYQDVEFIDAIVNHRACRPSFRDGVMAQAGDGRGRDFTLASSGGSIWNIPVPTEET
jgi:hypothetical protein